MKAIAQIFLVILTTFIAVENLSAQSLKWAYTNANHAQILGWAGDGRGALVVI